MRKLYFFVLLAGTIFISCSKAKDGKDGEPGPAGTANVIYSSWFVTGSGWVESTDATTPYHGEIFYFSKAVPGVTQAIIDNGVVLSYIKGEPLLDGTPAGTSVFQLPYTIGMGYDFLDVYDFALTPGNIRYLYKSDDPWEAADLAAISFRYVIIPGGVAGRGTTPTYNGHTVEELKKMSYAEVAALFSIPAEGTNIR